MDCSTPGFPVHHYLLELTQNLVHESVMPSNHLSLCRPLLLLLSIFPSIRVFSKESDLFFRWPKYWSFSFSISPSNEHSGLISVSIVKWSESEVIQLCPILWDLMDCSLPGSSVHSIFQAIVLEWIAISLSSIANSDLNYLEGIFFSHHFSIVCYRAKFVLYIISIFWLSQYISNIFTYNNLYKQSLYIGISDPEMQSLKNIGGRKFGA